MARLDLILICKPTGRRLIEAHADRAHPSCGQRPGKLVSPIIRRAAGALEKRDDMVSGIDAEQPGCLGEQPLALGLQPFQLRRGRGCGPQTSELGSRVAHPALSGSSCREKIWPSTTRDDDVDVRVEPVAGE